MSDLANKNPAHPAKSEFPVNNECCVGYTHIKILIVACLKFEFNLAFCILPANPTPKAKNCATSFPRRLPGPSHSPPQTFRTGHFRSGGCGGRRRSGPTHRRKPSRPGPAPGPASRRWGPPAAVAGRRAGGTAFPPPGGSGRPRVPAWTVRRPRRSSCRWEWRADQRAARAGGRHSRVAAPAGAARARHDAPGPEAHLQRLQDHVVLHVEEEPAGGYPLPPLHGPGRRGRRGRRLGGDWWDWGQQRRWRLRRGDLRQHLGRPSAEQRGRGRQAGELLRPLWRAEADRAWDGRRSAGRGRGARLGSPGSR